MNFDFAEEQEQIRQQARQLLSRRVSYDGLRSFCDAGSLFDRELWAELGELGWLGLTIPEDLGGLGLDGLEVCVLSEELGYALAPVPFFSTYDAIDAIVLFGSADQKARYLPALATGAKIATVARAETSDRQSIDTFATQLANGRLSGIKTAVANGCVADLMVVMAVEVGSGQPQLTVVETDQAGVERRPIKTFDRVREHALVHFTDAVADPLESGAGATAVAELDERVAIRTSFEQVGGAHACVRMAVDYALVRKTFGRLIGSYQAVKHRLADMHAETELARSNAFAGAWSLTQPAHERRAAAAAARLSATSAYDFASRENIQLHGGIGYTWEADCHFHFRRARLLAQSLGPTRGWVDRLVDSIESEAAA